jgi:hypothetical protein
LVKRRRCRLPAGRRIAVALGWLIVLGAGFTLPAVVRPSA